MPACRGLEDSNGYNEGHDAQRAMADFVLLTDIELDISARKGSFLLNCLERSLLRWKGIRVITDLSQKTRRHVLSQQCKQNTRLTFYNKVGRK